MKIDEAASRLEALGNATRLRIYRTLVKAGEPGLPVGKLQSRLSVPASTLSHHLKTLLVTGLITQERDATTLICRANYSVMRGLVSFLVEECCTDADCTSIRAVKREDDVPPRSRARSAPAERRSSAG